MLVNLIFTCLALAAIVFFADKLWMRYYQHCIEVSDAKEITERILQTVSSAPASEFFLRYTEEVVWLVGVKLISRRVSLPVWQRLLKNLTKSDKISVKFIMKDTPPVDIKITKKSLV